MKLPDIVPVDLLAKPQPKPPATYTNGYHANGNGYSADTSYAEIEKALSCMPSHFGSSGAGNERWVQILMSVHSEMGMDGVALCERYMPGKPGEIERRFQGFKPGGGVTIGTLFGIAKEYGYQSPKRTQADADADLPELSDEEIIAVVEGVPADLDYLTDLGNARRFTRMHGSATRYVEAWGWLVYDGMHWQTDKTGEVMRKAKETVLSLLNDAQETRRKANEVAREARAIKDNDSLKTKKEQQAEDLFRQAKLQEKWAMASQGRAHLQNMLTLAQSEYPIPARAEDFDKHPWLLNVHNGTIDLRTGELLPHSPSNLLTTLAPVDYDPDAQCPVWLDFLDRIMGGNQNLIGFIQRSLGYSLTGDVGEQKLFFAWGMGANGKSTLFNTVLSMLGEHYAGQAAPELLTIGKDRHPTEVADLRGRRFIASIEIDDGKRLAEGLVKQLTGGDKIKARMMRQDFFQFNPTHKLFLVANHKPVIRGTDLAIWRRICLIPFDIIIPEQERDKSLPAKLLRELPGILAWTVRGCLEWQRIGLAVPDEVLAATESYRAESDTLGGFLEECTEKHESARVGATAMFNAYRQWSGDARITQTRFGKLMSDRGFEKKRDYAGLHYLGFGLIDAEDSAPDDKDIGDALGL